MPKESKFRRFASPPYQILARNSNRSSVNSSVKSTRNDFYETLCNITSFGYPNQCGTNKTNQSECQNPWDQVRYDLKLTSPLNGEFSDEMNSKMAANQKARISDKRNNILPQFDKEQLKLFNKHLVEDMYKDKQCSNCGSRFAFKDIDKHLDMHFKINSIRRRIYKPCRLYYGTMNDFVSGTTPDAASLSLTNEGNKMEPVKCSTTKSGLLASAIIEVCHGCHEVISQFFNDEDEEWQLFDAIRRDSNVYHRICAHNTD